MTNYGTQTATTRPPRAEIVMALAIIALLIINLAATIYAVNYEPACVPGIAEETE